MWPHPKQSIKKPFHMLRETPFLLAALDFATPLFKLQLWCQNGIEVRSVTNYVFLMQISELKLFMLHKLHIACRPMANEWFVHL